ncbi:MAG: hypothetical protein HY360_02815 [Verrucomicrobia bacterium]|nr:hypothetical protein [Verrucomicrobiota bacterium]
MGTAYRKKSCATSRQKPASLGEGGFVAPPRCTEDQRRRGIACDERLDDLAAAAFRFFAEAATDAELKAIHDAILHGKTADLRRAVFQTPQPAPCNATIHKPATPTQGVLLLAESTAAPPAQRARPSEPVSYARRKTAKR